MAAEATFGTERVHVLRDASGAEAHVVPGIGANCIAFRTPVAGKTAHLLSTPPSLDALRSRPTFWGFPILSPYPGRHQTPFTWRGRRYAIQPNDRPGVAIHGIVAGAPWNVEEANEQRLLCRFDSESVPNRAERWPWPFTLAAGHEVSGGALQLTLTLENRAAEPVPHLLGLHPYFPMRFTFAGAPAASPYPTAADLAGPDGAAVRESCHVWIAGAELWEMKAGLGTGSIWPLDGAPDGAPYDLRRPRSVAELERTLPPPPGPGPFGDDTAVRGPRLPVLLYGKPQALRAAAGDDPSYAARAGGVASGIVDTASAVEMTLQASLAFGSLAIYCPPGQPFLSLEPRSAVSDALTLMNDPRDLATGVHTLQPGERWTARVAIAAVPTNQS